MEGDGVTVHWLVTVGASAVFKGEGDEATFSKVSGIFRDFQVASSFNTPTLKMTGEIEIPDEMNYKFK